VKIGVYFATWWERTMVFGVVVRRFGEVRERHVRREERGERVFLFMNIIIIRIAIVEPYI
jgi:hypothetical protein